MYVIKIMSTRKERPAMSTPRTAHPMTVRCRLALERAKKAFESANYKLDVAQHEFDEARDDLRNAEYDLSLNEGLDERKDTRDTP